MSRSTTSPGPERFPPARSPPPEHRSPRPGSHTRGGRAEPRKAPVPQPCGALQLPHSVPPSPTAAGRPLPAPATAARYPPPPGQRPPVTRLANGRRAPVTRLASQEVEEERGGSCAPQLPTLPLRPFAGPRGVKQPPFARTPPPQRRRHRPSSC